jgi:hypothetical protein
LNDIAGFKPVESKERGAGMDANYSTFFGAIFSTR